MGYKYILGYMAAAEKLVIFMPCPSIVQNDLGWSKLFGTGTNCLVMSNFFWPCPKYFGQVQIRLFWTSFHNLGLSKMIWI